MATVANQRHGMPSSGKGELDLIADSKIRCQKGPYGMELGYLRKQLSQILFILDFPYVRHFV